MKRGCSAATAESDDPETGEQSRQGDAHVDSSDPILADSPQLAGLESTPSIRASYPGFFVLTGHEPGHGE